MFVDLLMTRLEQEFNTGITVLHLNLLLRYSAEICSLLEIKLKL